MKHFYTKGVIEAGCDEAGRGPLAGPVVAAAVVLPQNFGLFENLLLELNDSKQLSEKKREALRPIILDCAIAYGIGSCSALEIDSINILNASFLAMHRALDAVTKMLQKRRPKQIIEHIIVDGNRFHPYRDSVSSKKERLVPYHCIVKGDAKYASIAAASILAKTERDHIMTALAQEYPQYKWDSNKGYPTKAHREAIEKFGPSPYHRMTYALLPELTLF